MKELSLSASSAHRWMTCFGSLQLEATIPHEEQDSPYAMEGTAAHSLAESCLAVGCSPHDVIGELIEVDHRADDGQTDFEVTLDMADAVSVYVDYVRASTTEDRRIETWIDLAPIGLPDGTRSRGIVDCADFDPETKHLRIIDYKHGAGVTVEAEENEQLLNYALGAVLDMKVKPDTITVTIVQPRAPHPDGPIREWTFGWDRLVEHRNAMLAAAAEVVKPDAPVGPVGDHCRWCRARAICPAQREHTQLVVGDAFAVEDVAPALPEPAALSQDEILRALDAAPAIEDWFKAIREYVQAALERGEDVPGWKLVAKRAYRKWADEAEAEEWLRQRFKVGEIFVKKLVSPAQAEKLVKQLPRTEIPEGFIVSNSSGFNLAHESNPKPALTPGSAVAEAFEAEVAHG